MVGTTHGATFDILDGGGTPSGQVIVPVTPKSPTRRDWDAFEEAFREENESSGAIPGVAPTPRERLVERFLSEAPRGDVMPAFDRIVLGEDGALWLRRFDPLAEIAVWTVSHSTRRTDVRMSAAWELLEAGRDYVITLQRDPWDVESVKVYRLER